MSPTRRTALWVLGILLAGAALRLAVWWVSPPINAFDDHLEPIALYATQWSRPAPDACWQCYQPPLYYALSAGVLRLSHLISGDFWTAWRSVQLLSVPAWVPPPMWSTILRRQVPWGSVPRKSSMLPVAGGVRSS